MSPSIKVHCSPVRYGKDGSFPGESGQQTVLRAAGTGRKQNDEVF
jgi:hypothetical protein